MNSFYGKICVAFRYIHAYMFYCKPILPQALFYVNKIDQMEMGGHLVKNYKNEWNQFSRNSSSYPYAIIACTSWLNFRRFFFTLMPLYFLKCKFNANAHSFSKMFKFSKNISA